MVEWRRGGEEGGGRREREAASWVVVVRVMSWQSWGDVGDMVTTVPSKSAHVGVAYTVCLSSG